MCGCVCVFVPTSTSLGVGAPDVLLSPDGHISLKLLKSPLSHTFGALLSSITPTGVGRERLPKVMAKTLQQERGVINRRKKS
jgi:hypothetical protein